MITVLTCLYRYDVNGEEGSAVHIWRVSATLCIDIVLLLLWLLADV